LDNFDVDLEGAMDSWWQRNRPVFAENSLRFTNEAIVIAKKMASPEAYEASKEKIRRLISTSRRSAAWKIPTNSWFIKGVKALFNLLGRFLKIRPAQLASHLTSVLTSYGGMSLEAAILLANQVESDLS